MRGLRSLLRIVTSDLRVGGSNPSGRATLARVSEEGGGKRVELVANWSPDESGIGCSRAETILRGVFRREGYLCLATPELLQAEGSPLRLDRLAVRQAVVEAAEDVRLRLIVPC
jgi:hypothetical protein